MFLCAPRFHFVWWTAHIYFLEVSFTQPPASYSAPGERILFFSQMASLAGLPNCFSKKSSSLWKHSQLVLFANAWAATPFRFASCMLSLKPHAFEDWLSPPNDGVCPVAGPTHRVTTWPAARSSSRAFNSNTHFFEQIILPIWIQWKRAQVGVVLITTLIYFCKCSSFMHATSPLA